MSKKFTQVEQWEQAGQAEVYERYGPQDMIRWREMKLKAYIEGLTEEERKAFQEKNASLMKKKGGKQGGQK